MDETLIIEEVVEIYDRRIEGYDRLIALAREQQAILLADRQSELAQNLTEFDPILLDLQQLDRRQDSFEERIRQAKASGRLSESLHPDTACGHLRQALMDRVGTLRGLVEANAHLLENKLSFANFTMGVVCGMVGGQRGAASPGSPSILLDLKV